jgi:PAS domain S-box-containing protein
VSEQPEVMQPAAESDAAEVGQEERRRPGRLPGFVAGSLGVLALLGAVAGALLFVVLDQRTADLHAALKGRLEAEANGRAQVLATWLERTARLGHRLTRSDLVRLFASEMAVSRPDRPPQPWLADQVPYMTQLIGDFVAQHGLLGATLIGRDGRIFLASRDAPLPERRSFAERIARLRGPSDQIVTPIREIGDVPAGPAGQATLALDLLLPVPALQAAEEGDVPAIPAVLVMTVAADALVAEALTPAGAGGAEVRLIQPGASRPEQIAATPEPHLDALEDDLTLAPGDALAYGALPRGDGGSMLAVGAPVPGLPWTVLEEQDAATALAPLIRYKQVAAALAAALALGFGWAFAVFWWRQRLARERTSRADAAVATSPGRPDRHLQPILDALPQMIGVKGRDGRYLHANRSFARALGRSPQEVVGRADADLLPPEAAHELTQACAQVAEGAVVPAICLAAEAGEPRRLSIGLARIEGGARTAASLLLLAQDASARSEARSVGEADRRMAEALLEAIRLRDGFLFDQTCRLRAYARAVGQRLGLDERELALLDLAGSLSQLGKIFLPDWLLAKPGPFTAEETRMMHGHFRQGIEVIGAIDFDLPVVEVMAEMHERLDGTGPEGLHGEQIGSPARVLGALEAFCARTAARGGRARMSPGQALYDLARNPGRFDVRVISALAAVVAAESQTAHTGTVNESGPGPIEASGETATDAAA